MDDQSEASSGVLIELNLRQNAYDFLEEALRYAERGVDDPVGWKFAVILAAQAIELLLKARLELEHPLLVQADPERAVPGPTVGVQGAIKRLSNSGVTIPPEDAERLHRAQRLRNEFVHYRVRATVEQLEAAFTDLFEFAHSFHTDHLAGELHDHISEDLYAAEAAMIERFRRTYVLYQGSEVHRALPSEVVDAQFALRVRIAGELFDRIRRGSANDLLPSEGPCHDCAVLPGQLHVWACDAERCPKCGQQMLSCECDWEWEFAEEIDQFTPRGSAPSAR